MTNRLHHYLRVYETTVTLFVLIVALLLPRISAVVVEFIPGIDTVVLCTGSDYVTITLDGEGSPVEVSETQDSDCLRGFADPIVQTPETLWQKLARSYAVDFTRRDHPAPASEVLKTLEPSRAPPVVI